MTFTTPNGYNVAAIMRDAHRRTKKTINHRRWTYAEGFSFYLGQVWITAQHEHRARICTGATITAAKAFDNGNSPLWRM